MAEASGQPVPPGGPHRRLPRWALALVVAAALALGAWVLVTYLSDRGQSAEERWQACATRVDSPADRSARIRELSEEPDKEAARERLAQETRSVERRIEAECGERP